MTLNEQVKILDNKIKASKAQYDLDREAAKISAQSSGELEKYEYLTGEDLGYKPEIVEKAKFEYSPLGKVFNKRLDESDRKEGHLKKLKNIESKNEQLKAIKDQGEKQLQILTKKTDKVVDFRNVSFRDKLYFRSKIAYNEIKEQDEKISYTKLVCIGPGKHQYNFTIFLDLKTFAESIYNSSLSLEAAKIKQRNMEDKIRKLDEYNTKKEKLKAQRKCTLLNANEFYKGRKMILIAFENGAFPLTRQYSSANMDDWK